jgi:hypothetical protein
VLGTFTNDFADPIPHRPRTAELVEELPDGRLVGEGDEQMFRSHVAVSQSSSLRLRALDDRPSRRREPPERVGHPGTSTLASCATPTQASCPGLSAVHDLVDALMAQPEAVGNLA